MKEEFNPNPARKPGTWTRRDVLGAMALGPLAVGLSGSAFAQGLQGVTVAASADLEATAGRWKTWTLPTAQSVLPDAAPHRLSFVTRRELAELRSLQAQRSDATGAIVQYWDAQGGVPAWSMILLNKIKETGTNPVLASRALALFHTAVADASIAAWKAKFTYRRLQPSQVDRKITSLSSVNASLPSYASEHAAVAAAAATVLNYLYPGQTADVHGQRMTFEAAALEAARSRLWAGANYRSDLEAGLEIGQAVGATAVARGQADGSNAVWDTVAQPGRPTSGAEYWQPTAPAHVPTPLLPLAGTWKPWLMESGSQFRPGNPPALQVPFPGGQFLKEITEVKDTVANLTPDELQIARFWADDPGRTFTPPGHWAQIATEQVAESGVSTPRAARALALVSAGLADAAISCWDCKYAYWLMRPITAIRTMVGQPFYDPNFVTPITTPPFPAYTSGHSTFSGSASTVLEHLFPGGKVEDAFGHSVSFAEAADQAAVSRLYGGIHYRSDNDEGLTCGRHIAELVVQRASTDGAR